MSSKITKFSIFSSIFIMLVLSLIYQKTLSPNLVINEMSFQNNNGNDWIEIYNPGLSARNLKDFYITDNPEEKTKFKIKSDIVVSPKGFIVVVGKNALADIDSIQMDFSIKNGEKIYLIAQNGEDIVDSFMAASNNENFMGTIGLYPDGDTTKVKLLTPTKGTENFIY